MREARSFMYIHDIHAANHPQIIINLPALELRQNTIKSGQYPILSK